MLNKENARNKDKFMLIALGILFLMLKLAGVIYWAWWIVLIPFYPLIGGLLVAVCAFTLGVVMEIMRAVSRKR